MPSDLPSGPRQRRAARYAQADQADRADRADQTDQADQASEPSTSSASTKPAKPPKPRRAPITLDRITDAALEVCATEGYDALTVRRITAILGTGPSSLYAHIVDRTDLDDLIMGRLSAQIVLPTPDPERWQDQIRDVYAQLRDQYLKYPGVSRAALAMVPTNLDSLRVREGIVAIMLAGGVDPQTAGWAADALSLYVAGYAMERSMVQQRQSVRGEDWVLSQDEVVHRFQALPPDEFPVTRKYATELTSGKGHDRFDFTLGLILSGLGS